MAKKKPKKKIGKSHLQFEISSGMDLPKVIDWQEQEVMDALATYFKQKLSEAVKKIYFERKKIYNTADFRIKCKSFKSEEIAQKIFNLYEK